MTRIAIRGSSCTSWGVALLPKRVASSSATRSHHCVVVPPVGSLGCAHGQTKVHPALSIANGYDRGSREPQTRCTPLHIESASSVVTRNLLRE
ncbi:hypothetical protein IQ06DRAFT_114380 [Phaeosphaeriaceae sp. SRC1lsM3a]|nr:hypothetical protein IQ06DRAFT_114380 [Stagonospora sp. SRC1lsM3a]